MVYHPLISVFLYNLDQEDHHPLMMFYTADKTSGTFFYESTHYFLRFTISVYFSLLCNKSVLMFLILTHLYSKKAFSR